MSRALLVIAALLSGCVDDALAGRTRHTRASARHEHNAYPNPYSGGALARSLNADGAGSEDGYNCGDWDGVTSESYCMVSFWYETDNDNTWSEQVGKMDTSVPAADYQFFIGSRGGASASGDDMRVVVGTGAGTIATYEFWSVFNVAIGVWKHYAVLFHLGADDIDLYVDAVEETAEATEALPTSFRASNADFRFAWSWVAGREPDSRLRGLAIYCGADAYTSDEVTAVYAAGEDEVNLNALASPPPSELKGWWPITNGDSETAATNYGRLAASCTSSTLESADISSDVP